MARREDISAKNAKSAINWRLSNLKIGLFFIIMNSLIESFYSAVLLSTQTLLSQLTPQ